MGLIVPTTKGGTVHPSGSTVAGAAKAAVMNSVTVSPAEEVAEHFYASYGPQLEAMARRLAPFGMKGMCEDMVQDVFATFWQAVAEDRLDCLHPDDAEPAGWDAIEAPCRAYLRTTLRSRSDYLRHAPSHRPCARLTHEHTEHLLAEDTPADEQSERDELCELVRQAVHRLPEWERTVVTLYHLAGLGYEEIAEQLEIPLGTVQSRLARGRGHLRTILEGLLCENCDPI